MQITAQIDIEVEVVGQEINEDSRVVRTVIEMRVRGVLLIVVVSVHLCLSVTRAELRLSGIHGKRVGGRDGMGGKLQDIQHFIPFTASHVAVPSLRVGNFLGPNGGASRHEACIGGVGRLSIPPASPIMAKWAANSAGSTMPARRVGG